MPLPSSPVAVTGSTGFLGSHVVRRLLEAGARVRAVYRTPAKAAWMADLPVEHAVADLAEPDSLVAAFEGCGAVVNTAALSTREPASWDEFHAANAVGSQHLMHACSQASVERVIHVSTTAVYRTRIWGNHDESTPTLGRGDRVGWARLVTNPRYALSKAIGEQAAWEGARAHALALTVLRPGPIYGSRDHKLTATYARLMERAVLPAPTFRLPHVHARDVAGAILGALDNPASAGRAYNVTGESISPWRVLRAWKGHLGRGPLLLPVPVPLWVDYDDSAARRDLDFAPRSIEEGIGEVLEAGGPAG